jgi:hypothetical protein
MSGVKVKQEHLQELIQKGLIKKVKVTETTPSKGQASRAGNKRVWLVNIVMLNGSESLLLSTRGSQREWASLDRLTGWLRSIGLGDFQVVQKG